MNISEFLKPNNRKILVFLLLATLFAIPFIFLLGYVHAEFPAWLGLVFVFIFFVVGFPYGPWIIGQFGSHGVMVDPLRPYMLLATLAIWWIEACIIAEFILPKRK